MIQQKLDKAKQAIEASEVLKSNFHARISYEVRSQLNCILGISQMIAQSKEADTDIQNDAKIITESGMSLLSLFNHIMDILKIEDRQINRNNKSFYVNNLMDELLSKPLLSPVCGQKFANHQKFI